MAETTHRNEWRDAIWSSDLKPLTRLVALCFADHAGTDGRNVWVATERGRARTGMSRATWFEHVRLLKAAGWLTEQRAGRAGRDGGSTARHLLTVPIESSSRTESTTNESGKQTNESGSETNESGKQHRSPEVTPSVPPTDVRAASPRASSSRALPEDWQATDAHRALAAELGVDLAAELEQFRDHHLAKGTTYVDWGRAFNTWIRNASKWSKGNRRVPQHRSTGLYASTESGGVMTADEWEHESRPRSTETARSTA